MIIQTGMRTDIPAFYSKWLLQRIREGYVLVRNPYNPVQVTRYSLSPEVVDLLAFCTKNPAPMLPVLEACYEKTYGERPPYSDKKAAEPDEKDRRLEEPSGIGSLAAEPDELRNRAAETIGLTDSIKAGKRFLDDSQACYGLTPAQASMLVGSVYWFVTITPYGEDIEPNVPDKETVMRDFIRLSELVGASSVGWRYDPVLVDGTHTPEWHIAQFEHMAKTLEGYTETCVISFIEIYKKVERNFPGVRAVSKEERLLIGKEFIRIAARHGMTVRPCAEGNDLAPFGADCSGCMTVRTFEKALNAKLDVPKQKSNQRSGQCACLLGTDIGAYDTCGHLCRYCYANTNAELVKKNMQRHDPASPFLLGNCQPGDKIHEAQQKSWLDRQMKLDLL